MSQTAVTPVCAAAEPGAVGSGGDAQGAQHHPVAVVDQQVEPAYGPVQHRPRRGHRARGHAERLREFQHCRRAHRNQRERLTGQLPLPVQQRHRAQQCPVVADTTGRR